jgi:hypothetical protein
MPEKKLTGRIAADRIRMQSTPKPPDGAVGRSSRLANAAA